MTRLPKIVIAEALAELVRARVALKFRKFDTLVPRQERRLVGADDATIRMIARVLDGWTRRLPWQPVCFDRAIAAERMLVRRGHDAVLHYGSRRGNDGLEAHVWVSSGGAPVVGHKQAGDFTELARFPPADRLRT